MCSSLKTAFLLISCIFLMPRGVPAYDIDKLNKMIGLLKVNRKFEIFWSDLNDRCTMDLGRVIELYGKSGVHNGTDDLSEMVRVRFKKIIMEQLISGYELDLDRALTLYGKNDIHNGVSNSSVELDSLLKGIIVEQFVKLYNEDNGKFRVAFRRRLRYLRSTVGAELILDEIVERITNRICPSDTEGLYPNVRYYHNTLPLALRFYFFRSLCGCIRRYNHSWTIIAAHWKVLHDTNLAVTNGQASELNSLVAPMPQDLRLIYIAQQPVTLYNVQKGAAMLMRNTVKYIFNNCVQEEYRVCLATLDDQQVYTQLLDHLIVDWVEDGITIRRSGEFMCAQQGMVWLQSYHESCLWRVYPVAS